MKNTNYAVPGSLFLLLLPASQCFAQAATLSECQEIEDRLARYACYDKWDSASGTVRQSAAAPRATTTPSRPDAAAEAAPQAPASAANARVVEGDRGTELIDTIAAIEERGPNMVRVTLESGQQWQQMISKRYPLEAGDEVRIYPTRWGSAYRLSTERVGGYIQVERVDDGSGVTLAGPAPAPRAAPAQEAGLVQEEDKPGLLGRTVGAVGGIFSRDSDEGAQGSELFDTISSLEQTGSNLWLITLESGQQWRQMISKRYTLEVGDEVRIYPSRWGSAFRLSSERAGGYIQVERVD